jgi:large subunit ribosomal protein L10
MNREQKAAVVEEIAGQIQAAEAVFAVDYRGLSVPQAAELRAKLRSADATFRIVKNSLTELAADKAGVEGLKALLDGPTALTLVHGDAALAAKALNDTARALQILEFKGGFLNGDPLSGEDIRSIARLPAREVLHGQLVGTIAAPLSGLVRTLNALIVGLAIQLQGIADQGLVSGTEPASPSDAPRSEEPEADAGDEATRGASDQDATSDEQESEAVAEPEPESTESDEPEQDPAPDADASDE